MSETAEKWWECTHDDFDWLIACGLKYYSKQIENIESTRVWVRNAIDSPNVKIVRTEDSVVFGVLALSFFDKFPTAHAILFWGNHCRVLFKIVYDWAKKNSAKNGLQFCASTGVDIAPLAKRLGAEPDFPSYIMRF